MRFSDLYERVIPASHCKRRGSEPFVIQNVVPNPTSSAVCLCDIHAVCIDSCKIPFNLELGVFGGLLTPVCSYTLLSEGFLCYLCHSTSYWGLTLSCVVLYCRLRALLAELPW